MHSLFGHLFTMTELGLGFTGVQQEFAAVTESIMTGRLFGGHEPDAAGARF